MTLNGTLLTVQIFGVAGLIWISSGASAESVLRIGDLAPAFSVRTDDGRIISRDEFGGKLLMVNFWATWCPPCVYEMPSLSAFASRFQSRGVTVVAISFDEDHGSYREFLRTLKPPFLTTRAAGRGLAAAFGTFRIPETYIVDRSGRVVRKYVDARDWLDPSVVRDVEELLQ